MSPQRAARLVAVSRVGVHYFPLLVKGGGSRICETKEEEEEEEEEEELARWQSLCIGVE